MKKQQKKQQQLKSSGVVNIYNESLSMLFRTRISNIMIYAESAPQFLIPRNYSDDINKLPLIQKLFYISFKLANAINSRREEIFLDTMNYHSMHTGAHGYRMSNEFNRKIE